MTDRYRIAVLGASGYTGADLVRLLAQHPAAEIVLLSGERKAGQAIGDVLPHLIALDAPRLVALADIDWQATAPDVVFCALPHATSQQVIARLLDTLSGVRVIDLSADFRLRDPAIYEAWYGGPHQAPEAQAQAVYGLPELYGDTLGDAQLVACPGCYPTAALLALVPLVEAGLIDPDDIVIDAKSGVTGAGRGLKEANLFCEVAEALHPYGVGHHRHMPEIEQQLALAAGRPVRISFTAHLVPMNRGELETIYVRTATGADGLKAALAERYRDEPFVHVLDGDRAPATRMVRGSNNCVLNVFADRIDGRAIVIAAIDNLVKGSSGQAIQVMNRLLGLDETLGLRQEALFP